MNLGIQEAKGEYIARLDADDTSAPTRLAKQVAFLDAHPEVGVCGSWQHHYGPDRDWVHRAPADPQMCKARLLFWCDLCHSTLMLRRSVFVDNGLSYDPTRKAEDYDLWTRAMMHTEIANIPEVLGEYKEDGTGITDKKRKALHAESGQIVAATLNRLWGMELDEFRTSLLCSWENDYRTAENREERLRELQSLLRQIWEANRISPFFEEKALLQVLACKWHWAKNGANWEGIPYKVQTIDDVFDDAKSKPSLLTRFRVFLRNNPSNRVRAKKIVKLLLKTVFAPVLYVIRKLTLYASKYVIEEMDRRVEGWTWDRYQRTAFDIENWTWQRYRRSRSAAKTSEGQIVDLLWKENRTEYHPGEKIRIFFLFQVASFWPSWDSFYKACLEDDRFEVTFALFEGDGDVSQMKTAKEFLDSKGIPYEIYSDELICRRNPHVVVLQSPYDGHHRPENIQSKTLRAMGIRVVYITYGIEISDTPASRKAHFMTAPLNCWRVYTFNELMRWDYMRYCPNGAAARSFGHPKFDALYLRKATAALPDHVEQLRRGRKVMLWHVHFPKYFPGPDGKQALVTPYLTEYLKYVEYMEKEKDLFFIFLPHPKFLDCTDDLNAQANEIVTKLNRLDNVYMAWEDEYTDFLLCSDYIISDRSALMVEAAAVDVPVLYMSNADYEEPMTTAILPLMDSYVHGHVGEDMVEFTESCKRGEDTNREARHAAFNRCIPYFDGKSGERIRNDIADSLLQEASQLTIEQRLDRLEAMLAELQKNG